MISNDQCTHHSALLSQHLNKRGQVFLANSHRQGALEDAGNIVGKFIAHTGIADLGLEALYALLPDPNARTGMETAKCEGFRMSDLGQFSYSGGKRWRL